MRTNEGRGVRSTSPIPSHSQLVWGGEAQHLSASTSTPLHVTAPPTVTTWEHSTLGYVADVTVDGRLYRLSWQAMGTLVLGRTWDGVEYGPAWEMWNPEAVEHLFSGSLLAPECAARWAEWTHRLAIALASPDFDICPPWTELHR